VTGEKENRELKGEEKRDRMMERERAKGRGERKTARPGERERKMKKRD